MESFLKEAIGSIKTTGTVKPSSKYLIRDILKDIDFDGSKTILEFGAGDGCITEELSLKMNEHSQLFAYEVNPSFFKFCTDKFSSQTNIKILNQSALDFDITLKEQSISEVDYIVSSLPLALFKGKTRKLLINKVALYLKTDGMFVQYQYSLANYWLLAKTFEEVNIDITIRNLPPAFVYKCHKK